MFTYFRFVVFLEFLVNIFLNKLHWLKVYLDKFIDQRPFFSQRHFISFADMQQTFIKSFLIFIIYLYVPDEKINKHACQCLCKFLFCSILSTKCRKRITLSNCPETLLKYIQSHRNLLVYLE